MQYNYIILLLSKQNMLKKLSILAAFFLLTSCSGDDDFRNDNPYLVDLNFSFQMDLNFPQYNDLQFPGNAFVNYNYGINGVVIYNVNNSVYTAFEFSDPNHPLTDCSTLELNGTEVSCRCEDGNKYSIITGQQLTGDGQYPLKAYRIERRGSVLEISN